MCLLTCVCGAWAAPKKKGKAPKKDLAPEFKTEAVAVQKACDRLEAVRYQMLGRLSGEKKGEPLQLLLMTLSKAVIGGDLHIEILLEGTKSIRARCWSQRLGRSIDIAKPADLGLSKSAINGSFSVNLPADLALGGKKSRTDQKTQITAAITGGRISGKYSADGVLGKKAGSISGTVKKIPGVFAVPTGIPKRDIGKVDPYEQYALAIGLEKRAVNEYREIRAIEAATRSGRSLTECLRRSKMLTPIRPEFISKAKKQSGPVKTGQPPPEIDDLDGDVDLGLEDEVEIDAPAAGGAKKQTKSAIADDPDASNRLGVLKIAHAGVDRLLKTVEAHLKTPPGGGSAIVESVDDPMFGPWYGFVPMPSKKGKPNNLPADAGSAGIQHWPYVTNWRLLGPVKRHGLPARMATLPEFFPDPKGTATYKLADKVARDAPADVGWQDLTQWPGSGTIWCPPFRAVARLSSGSGLKDCAFYYHTEVHSGKDVELYLAAMADDMGELWLNGRLLGAWPKTGFDLDLPERVAMFKAKFRKGVNELLLRVDHVADHTGFWVRICTRGKPRSAAVAKTEIAALDKAVAATRHLPKGVRGWQGDWTANRPDAKPVTAWDIKQGINVKWRVPFPQSKATPVIVGNKVFTTIDPFFLVCADKMTGNVLWEREANILEIENPELYEESKKLYKAYREPWAELVKYGISPYERVEGDQKEGMKSRSDLEKEVREAHKKWWKFIVDHVKCPGKLSWGNSWSGHAYATPVTDGKHIWFKNAANSTSCWDLDGNRKWMVRTDYVSADFDHMASPVLVDGKLIMQIAVKEKKGRGKKNVLKFLCLDAETGKTLWWSGPIENRANASTPVVMRLTNGEDSMAVVISAGGSGMRDKGKKDKEDPGVFHCGGGTVVRVDDGKTLIADLGVESNHGTPVVHGDVIYHMGAHIHAATRLIMIDRDHIGAKRLWTRKGLVFVAGMVYRDGYLYGQAGDQWSQGYWIFDAGTGAVARRTGHIGRGGAGTRAYVFTAIGGDYIYWGDMGSKFGAGYYGARASACCVVRIGRDGRYMANNFFDHHVMCAPVFDGDRFYVRSDWSLYCIGHTGEEDRKYEAEINAKNVLSDWWMEPTPKRDARGLKPIRGLRYQQRGPNKPGKSNITYLGSWRDVWYKASHELAQGDWGAIGPLPLSDEAESRKVGMALADRMMRGHGMGQVPWKGKTLKPEGRGDQVQINGKQMKAELTDKKWRRKDIQTSRAGRACLNAGAACKLGAGDVGYLFSILVVRDKQTWRLRKKAWGGETRVWISGEEIKDLDRITLVPGDYPVIVEGSMKEASDSGLSIYVGLTESETCEAENKAWLDSIRNHKEIFERIVKYMPDSKYAEKAAALLAKLK